MVFVIMIMGAPVAYSFGLGALLFLILNGLSLGPVASTAFYAMNSFAFLAIPLFVLAGDLMTRSGIADRLVGFSSSLLKNVKGAMGAAVIFASMFFGMLTGSNIATITAIAGIMKEPMMKMGYKKEYIAGVLAASGPLGYMIPPNTNAIMFAVIASCSVSDLFLSTVVPGLIWAIMMMVVNRFLYKKYYDPSVATEEYKEIAIRDGDKIPGETIGTYFKDLGKTFVLTIPALIMPLIIFGGIYGGIFTATEAGAVSGVYAIILGVIITKNMKAKGIWDSFTSTGKQMGTILFITPFAAIFTYVLVTNGAPAAIANFFLSVSNNKIILLLLLDAVFIVSGFFVGPAVIIFVITPLLMPTAAAMGIDTIQLGVMLFVAIGIGNITPPMAFNLFIAARVVDVEVSKVIKPLYYYFIFTGVPMLLLVTFVPELSLWLPRLISG
nr:TRAP transporter large permease [Alkalibaculum sporogenes]